MSFLNASFQFLIYEDKSPRNPLVRTPDITKEFKEIPVSSEKSDKTTLFPGDIATLATTARTLGWTGSTELEFFKPDTQSDKVRLRWTGTGPAPVFRIARTIGGDATTTVDITRTTPYVARLTSGVNTWNTASVQIGDTLKIEKTTVDFTSPFSTTNQGTELQVTSKGNGYIEVIDNGVMATESVTLGADFAEALKVFNQGPVKTLDTIFLAGFNPSNNGKFAITGVSPDYIEFVNPYVIEETILLQEAVIYNYIIGFLFMKSSGPVKVKFGGQTEWFSLNPLGTDAILCGSVSTHEVQAMNDGNMPIDVFVQTARNL